MAHLNESKVTLRISGDLLDPDEITKLLGGVPTLARKKDEIIVGKVTGKSRQAKTGQWHISALSRTPEDFNGQVEEILNGLSQDIKIWENLGRKFELDLFCGAFMQETDEGFGISAKTLMALGMRGIDFELCIYGPTKEDLEKDEKLSPIITSEA